MARMQTGRLVDGKIVVDAPPPEGTVVTVLEHESDDEDWELTPEEQEELEARLESARRGELITSAELWKRADAAKKA